MRQVFHHIGRHVTIYPDGAVKVTLLGLYVIMHIRRLAYYS